MSLRDVFGVVRKLAKSGVYPSILKKIESLLAEKTEETISPKGVNDYLINMFIDLGLVTEDQKKQAESKVAAGDGIVEWWLSQGIIKDADLASVKAAHFGAEAVLLSKLEISDDVIKAIPSVIVEKYHVVPIEKNGKDLTIAISDPSDLDTIDSLGLLLGQDINLKVATEADIGAALQKYYGITPRLETPAPADTSALLAKKRSVHLISAFMKGKMLSSIPSTSL
jgi:hypothetical protein